MRKLIAAAFVLPLAAALPAAANTAQEIAAHGMIVTIADMVIDLNFTPDGKFNGMDGAITGTWRVDGEKLCTTSNLDPNETCAEYPKDKKSGDSFDLVTPQGSVPIKIK
ncbi:hypothetical protein [Phenylobacterium sp.]|uniref:hypothetical protein n=1 Tax=Phenylobacterium sp. TaxID=1871053 RepID=UPI0011F59D69|nr:hypothetical protein [Phenylobacterium sp.]THD61395.1 MAG: hypothetical protein E8A49_10385 [Phenylobacterium sp.]